MQTPHDASGTPILTTLSGAGLLTPECLAEAHLLRDRCRSDSRLAAELVRRGWLTPLQARWLARGRVPVVGPYLLLERLGRGGMGEVFLARHRLILREAALKVVRPGPAAGRFLRECEALGRLAHPNVVHAFDAGQERGVSWLALEYLPGPDLERLCSEGPLEPGLACAYASQAAGGLAHVHERGLVHRDVKPSNLALGKNGEVKVLDVGLARPGWGEAVGGEGEVTRAGVLVGTVDYAAPEQVADSRRPEPAVDQYGLGATLYRLLAGRVPFPEGTAVARALQRLTEDPRPVGELRPGLPPGLCEVVGRMMARRPEDRFGSMSEAAVALSRYAAADGSTVLDLPALSGTREAPRHRT